MKPQEDYKEQYDSPSSSYSHRITHSSNGLSECLTCIICIILLVPFAAIVLKASVGIVAPSQCEVKRHV